MRELNSKIFIVEEIGRKEDLVEYSTIKSWIKNHILNEE